jgi:hypothetical protein
MSYQEIMTEINVKNLFLHFFPVGVSDLKSKSLTYLGLNFVDNEKSRSNLILVDVDIQFPLYHLLHICGTLENQLNTNALVSFWALYSIILIHFIANTILEYWNLSLG